MTLQQKISKSVRNAVEDSVYGYVWGSVRDKLKTYDFTTQNK